MLSSSQQSSVEPTNQGKAQHNSSLDSLWHHFGQICIRGHIGAYSLAIVCALLAFLLRLSIDPWLGNQSPYVIFIVAVAVTGLYAGVRPALLAAALGALFAYFSFVPPRYHWGFRGVSDAVGFGVYMLAAIAVVLLTHARIQAAAKAERALQGQIEVERKLLDAESLFRHFMDHSSACTYLSDDTGQVVYANEVAKREFGIGSDRQIDAEMQTGTTSDYTDQDQKVLHAGHAIDFADKTWRSGGERYWLTSKFPFVERSGKKFVGAISVEITDRIQAEEILRKTERLAAAGQMASLLAHEVNNPLAALTNLIFLLSQQPLPLPAREFVSQASGALERINRIASMTLGFYVDRDTPAAVELCRVIDEVTEMLVSVESFTHIRVERRFKFHGTVVASPPRIRQLITNLLANAMESGAQIVSIRVRLGQDWHQRGRTGVYITVADNGRGIRRQLYPHLFEPFFSTKPEKGTGLGLWASRAIVLRNDGTIQLRSSADTPRTGTCVRVFLPTIIETRDTNTNFSKAASARL